MLLIIWTWKNEGLAEGRPQQNLSFFPPRSLLKPLNLGL
jgi:hypothetical protein